MISRLGSSGTSIAFASATSFADRAPTADDAKLAIRLTGRESGSSVVESDGIEIVTLLALLACFTESWAPSAPSASSAIVPHVSLRLTESHWLDLKLIRETRASLSASLTRASFDPLFCWARRLP